jgi:hypothetical protein
MTESVARKPEQVERSMDKVSSVKLTQVDDFVSFFSLA